MVAELGFTTILGAFSDIGIWARLARGRVVLDVPFNPTYGLSEERSYQALTAQLIYDIRYGNLPS